MIDSDYNSCIIAAVMDNRHANGKKFKEAREAKGLTQEDVAAHLGVTFGQVGHYESGRSFPPWEKLLKLCALLDIELNDLVKAA